MDDDVTGRSSRPPGLLSEAPLSLSRERPLRLGKYRMIARVGTGGGATVYLALASGAAGVNKLLVVKVLREDLADDPSFVAMFLDEARLSTRLNHPNIVQVIEVGQEGGFHFIVMEYLEGKPLARLIDGDVPGVGRDVVLHLIAESLDGLHYAHELADYDGTPLGVVHRDFSPQNIFVTYDGHAKLLDFGVAKVLTSSVQTEIDVLKGKPRYMAPEQMSGQKVDRRADVFSAGIVLWEAVAGRRMWAGKTDVAVMYAVGSGRIPRIEAVAPKTPPELVRILSRALALSRDDRYPTALALQEDLESYLRRAGEPVRPRDIGRVLTGQFIADRAQISAAVETQLKSLATESAGFRLVSLPDIETGALGASESSNSRPRPLSNPPSSPPTVIPSSVRPAPSRRSSWMLLGVAAVVAACCGSVYRLVFHGPPLSLEGLRERIAGPSEEHPSDAPPGTPLVPATTPPVRAADAPTGSLGDVAAPTVKLTFRASPPESKLFLDGMPLQTNPFSGEFPKTTATHVLRAEAPGYTTRAEPFSFARDASLDMALPKLDPPPAPAVASAAPAAADSSAAPPVAAPPASPVHIARPLASPPPAPLGPPAQEKKAPVDATNPYDDGT